LVGVAVKFTVVPAQILELSATMLTAGTAEETTLIVNEFEVTVVGLGQAAFDVSSQVITSLFANVEVVYVINPVPTFDPFIFH
jgi:hypothetical protein